MWLRQYEQVEKMNVLREEVADQLEDGATAIIIELERTVPEKTRNKLPEGFPTPPSVWPEFHNKHNKHNTHTHTHTLTHTHTHTHYNQQEIQQTHNNAKLQGLLHGDQAPRHPDHAPQDHRGGPLELLSRVVRAERAAAAAPRAAREAGGAAEHEALPKLTVHVQFIVYDIPLSLSLSRSLSLSLSVSDFPSDV